VGDSSVAMGEDLELGRYNFLNQHADVSQPVGKGDGVTNSDRALPENVDHVRRVT
jgi:hypothetical protein